MSVFSVCSKFVESCGNEEHFLFNVLYTFLQENELRIAIDQGGKVLDHYAKAAEFSVDLKRWLIHLGRKYSICIEPIDIAEQDLEHDELFVEVALRIVPNPCLITWSLQHYDGWATDEIEILDRLQAAHRVKKIATGQPGRTRKRAVQKATIIHNKGVLKMTGDKYSANQVGAMGPNSRADNNQFNQISNGDIGFDLNELLPQLATLRTSMREMASDPEHDIAVAEIAKAESAAKAGDNKGVLAHLGAAGKWAAEIAGKVGIGIAEKAIEKAMGMN